VGDVALVAYGPGDRRFHRSPAGPSTFVTLNARAWLAFVVLTLVMSALLFGSAGSSTKNESLCGICRDTESTGSGFVVVLSR
jgi:hypothetical protein